MKNFMQGRAKNDKQMDERVDAIMYHTDERKTKAAVNNRRNVYCLTCNKIYSNGI
jgi:hypothetical protein